MKADIDEHVSIIQMKGPKDAVKYVEIACDSLGEMLFNTREAHLEPVSFDVKDRVRLDEEACALLDLEPWQLVAELPEPLADMKSAISWAVNYELGTAVLIEFYPDSVVEARGLTRGVR